MQKIHEVIQQAREYSERLLYGPGPRCNREAILRRAEALRPKSLRDEILIKTSMRARFGLDG